MAFTPSKWRHTQKKNVSIELFFQVNMWRDWEEDGVKEKQTRQRTEISMENDSYQV